jgi:hypothetical protein
VGKGLPLELYALAYIWTPSPVTKAIKEKFGQKEVQMPMFTKFEAKVPRIWTSSPGRKSQSSRKPSPDIKYPKEIWTPKSKYGKYSEVSRGFPI